MLLFVQVGLKYCQCRVQLHDLFQPVISYYSQREMISLSFFMDVAKLD